MNAILSKTPVSAETVQSMVDAELGPPKHCRRTAPVRRKAGSQRIAAFSRNTTEAANELRLYNR